MALHDAEEFHHDLRGRANENLALSTALSIDNVFLQKGSRSDKQNHLCVECNLPNSRSRYAVGSGVSKEGYKEG